ncbi:MAG: nicotinate-nucleotide adenylyltransferase [Candidatus Omnitrophota bacterium]|nr:nicotinate-nucleotide adenylyltransferase [Candidatus Omnitrophota bacterium]
MEKKRRIGIFGGTFNPPHLGHLVLAREALEKLKLDKIIFIPSYLPPHKKIGKNNAYMRCRMVSLACKGNPAFKVSKIELERKTVSYSVDTLKRLKRQYGKKAKLFFIIGSDSLYGLETWKHAKKLFTLTDFVVGERPGFPIRKTGRKIKVIKIPLLDISSSMLRSRVRRCLSIRYTVPERVRDFIERYGLYK